MSQIKPQRVGCMHVCGVFDFWVAGRFAELESIGVEYFEIH